jgi:hypothetical protein
MVKVYKEQSRDRSSDVVVVVVVVAVVVDERIWGMGFLLFKCENGLVVIREWTPAPVKEFSRSLQSPKCLDCRLYCTTLGVRWPLQVGCSAEQRAVWDKGTRLLGWISGRSNPPQSYICTVSD